MCGVTLVISTSLPQFIHTRHRMIQHDESSNFSFWSPVWRIHTGNQQCGAVHDSLLMCLNKYLKTHFMETDMCLILFTNVHCEFIVKIGIYYFYADSRITADNSICFSRGVRGVACPKHVSQVKLSHQKYGSIYEPSNCTTKFGYGNTREAIIGSDNGLSPDQRQAMI